MVMSFCVLNLYVWRNDSHKMEDQQHRPWHAMTFQQAEEILGTSEKGLSDEEAARRLEK